VTVTATHVESNIQTSAQTNNAGVYTLPQLKEGQYTVGAKNAGFKEFISENVVLRARDTRRLDIVLEVGAVETKVEVTGGATLIETETARISDSKDGVPRPVPQRAQRGLRSVIPPLRRQPRQPGRRGH
jgi:hypothetical protein